jgi:signal transduction histidine kinase
MPLPMRLADFILANIEPILVEWEAFARGIWPEGDGAGATADPVELRDHAEAILRATAQDMKAPQTARQQSAKSKGRGGRAGPAARRMTEASALHAVGRVGSGFDLQAVISEYRALRASVIRLWKESVPTASKHDLDDLTRFNESIDQSLADATASFAHRLAWSRQLFLAMLAHDLRTPLSAVTLIGKILASSGQLDVEKAKLATSMSLSTAAMSRMIGDLLDFAGNELGSPMPLSPQRTDLETLCDEVLGETQAAHPTRTLRFKPTGDLTGEWDRLRLRQLISNLLVNALEHGDPTGPVDLSASGKKAHVQFAVRNQGPPIPQEMLASIFDPLVRGELFMPVRQQTHDGHIGLGLYIARTVAMAHGGTIEVSSSAQAGTVFTVRLPHVATSQPGDARPAGIDGAGDSRARSRGRPCRRP